MEIDPTHHLDLCAAPLVRFSLPGRMRVDGHENSLHPEVADHLEELLRLGPVPVDVELHEEGLVGAGLATDDLGQRGRRIGRYLQYKRVSRVSRWLVA